ADRRPDHRRRHRADLLGRRQSAGALDVDEQLDLTRRTQAAMSTYGLLMAAPALALLVWAALEDLRSRRIPNWLTFSLVLGGIGQSVAFGAICSPGASLLGFVVGFALPFVLFALGALGGGDVRLLAGVGAWC